MLKRKRTCASFICFIVKYEITPFVSPMLVFYSIFNETIVKVQDGWLLYSPMLIPRQLRFSLYSGAVITEGLM